MGDNVHLELDTATGVAVIRLDRPKVNAISTDMVRDLAAIAAQIAGDDTVWEEGPLQGMAAAGELAAYDHDGFWQPMDTLREKNQLEALWDSGAAPWKVWS